MRLRIAYAKKGEAKYIAHLDLTRVFERALRRAGIAMAYSEGFNPHPKISFGSALAVGVEGEKEYVDIELAGEMDLKEVLGSLQEQLPPGIRILEGQELNDGAKALMAILNSARYQVRVPMALPIREEKLQEAIQSWLNRQQVSFSRYSKKGQVEKDIRPWVKEIIGQIENETVVLEMEIEVGNQGSVRPEEVAASLRDLENLSLDLDGISIRRLGIYVYKTGRKFSPFDRISAS